MNGYSVEEYLGRCDTGALLRFLEQCRIKDRYSSYEEVLPAMFAVLAQRGIKIPDVYLPLQTSEKARMRAAAQIPVAIAPADVYNSIRNRNKERITMYTIYVKYICLPQKRQAYLEKMKESGILEAIRGEEGCLRYDYYLSEKDENELLLLEQWETKAHQQIHLTQPHMQQLRNFKGAYIARTELGEIRLEQI